jgi:hypothetical protein
MVPPVIQRGRTRYLPTLAGRAAPLLRLRLRRRRSSGRGRRRRWRRTGPGRPRWPTGPHPAQQQLRCRRLRHWQLRRRPSAAQPRRGSRPKAAPPPPTSGPPEIGHATPRWPSWPKAPSQLRGPSRASCRRRNSMGTGRRPQTYPTSPGTRPPFNIRQCAHGKLRAGT